MMPTDPEARKDIPIFTGVLDYFPDAIIEIAKVSKTGSEQHSPGQPIYWDRHKSSDHADCAVRHLMERNELDTDGTMHLAKAAWRILALLQITIEENEREEANLSGSFPHQTRFESI